MNNCKGKKIVMEAELQSIEVAYTTLKDQAQGLAFELSYMEKTLAASYNQVVSLRQEILEVRASQVSLWDKLATIYVELAIVREETQRS